MIKITKPGLLTTIQDLGRFGYQKYGVIASGVMDSVSHRLANILVGNDEDEATIEMTLLGPNIEFMQDSLIAICGGNLSASIEGKPVKMWRPVLVKSGSTLQFTGCKKGCRAYLAVAGGFDVPKVMDSKSTYIRAEFGGFQGRALKEEDQLPIGQPSSLAQKLIDHLTASIHNDSFAQTSWRMNHRTISGSSPYEIRVIKGRQFEWFTKMSQSVFLTEPFEVTAQSDRMGYRLKGAQLELSSEQEMLSEPVQFGSIQVPAEGNPIILLADRQTTGGYPKIGQIISVDQPTMAQLKPGDKIRFVEISHEEAQRLYLDQEKQLQQLKQGFSLKIRQLSK